MSIVFDQQIHVYYWQFYVESRTDGFFELTESLGGQANGLCGAAVPGLLFLTTGLHTGRTRVTVEALEDARLLLLGGAPMDGPRYIEWNFVSSSQERIARAKEDWKAMRFGKIPGDDVEFIPLPERRS